LILDQLPIIFGPSSPKSPGSIGRKQLGWFQMISKKDMGLTLCRLDLFMDFPLFADDVHNYVKSLAWIFSLPD
jgi:hypothetical protein